MCVFGRAIVAVLLCAGLVATGCSTSKPVSDSSPSASDAKPQALVLTYAVLHPERATEAEKRARVEQTVESLERRLSELRLTGADVRTEGVDEVMVVLPGLAGETVRLSEIIADRSPVRMYVVDDEAAQGFFESMTSLPSGMEIVDDGGPALQHPDREALQDFLEDRVDDEHAIVYQFFPRYTETSNLLIDESRSHWRAYYVQRRAPITGADVADAEVFFDPMNDSPCVILNFDARGGQLFEALTRQNVGNRLAVVVGDEVVATPAIAGRVRAGTPVRIALEQHPNFDRVLQRAEHLAQSLDRGSLTLRIALKDERVVTYEGPAVAEQ